MDRLISSGLSVIIVSLITVCFLGGVVCGYRGVLDGFAGHWEPAVARFTACALALGATLLLVRHRDDLMDRA